MRPNDDDEIGQSSHRKSLARQRPLARQQLERWQHTFQSDELNEFEIGAARFLSVARALRSPRPMGGAREAGVDVLLLVLETDQGLKGVGETPVRLNWHASTLKSLMVVLEEVFLPQMKTLDLADADAVKAFLGTFKEHPLAKSLIDTACWDLRARVAGVPLWQHLGATDSKVPISWTITRADPQDMAREAGMISERYGIHAFKVKTGQGFETDGMVLENIRRVVGDKVALYADSNGAHHAAEVPDMSKLLADHGVILFEDPCAFAPNDAFRSIVESSRVPILVDNGCRSVSDAMLFLGVGAKALSVKVMKTGITEFARDCRSCKSAAVTRRRWHQRGHVARRYERARSVGQFASRSTLRAM